MNISTLVIPLGFIFLSAVLLWCLIGSKGKWWVKLALIAALPSFGLAVWNSMASYLGWPTSEDTPDKALLLWGEVREPDQKTGDPGAIYLWLQSFDEKDYQTQRAFGYKADVGEPRAYKFPYSRKLHERLHEAAEMIKAGKQVVMDKTGKGDGKEGEGDSGKEGDGTDSEGGDRRGRDGSFSRDPDKPPLFYELPPPSMPGK